MQFHLTDLSVRTLKATAAQRTYWDDTTPGFGVRVGRRAKTWTIMRGSARERVTIGRYPDLSLTDARKEAKRLLSAVPEPKIDRIRFETAKAQFLEENYRHHSLRAKSEATRLLTKHFGTLDKSDLHEVDDTHIKKHLDRLSQTPSEQLHAYRTVRCFLKWCTRPPRRYLKHSPMEGYEPPSKDRKGTRTLSDNELVAVWKASPGVVRLLILWGTRQTETTSLERGWNVGRVMTIPGTHTKNKRDHAIPILPMARTLLDEAIDNPQNGHCKPRHYFPSRWGESHLSNGCWSKLKREIQEKSGTKDWQLRDLRRTFRSNMARLKVPREICELLINHAPEALDEIYNRYEFLEEKREALLKYEQFLKKLIGR